MNEGRIAARVAIFVLVMAIGGVGFLYPPESFCTPENRNICVRRALVQTIIHIPFSGIVGDNEITVALPDRGKIVNVTAGTKALYAWLQADDGGAFMRDFWIVWGLAVAGAVGVPWLARRLHRKPATGFVRGARFGE